MKKIYNDESNKFADWTTKKLKYEAIGYNEMIYGEYPCYRMRDMRTLDAILVELDNRGVVPVAKLTFNK